MFWWTVALLIRHHYDFVDAHEEAVFYCRLLKPIFRFKMIYDMHSSLPQQLDNFEFTESRLIKKIIQEPGRLVAESSRCSPLRFCPDLSDCVHRSDRWDDPKHFLIENSIFDPVRLARSPRGSERDEAPVSLPRGKKNRYLRRHFRKNTRVSSCSSPRLLLSGDKVADAFLLMVGGDDSQVAELRELAEENGLEKDVLFTGRVPQHLAKHYNSIAGRAHVTPVSRNKYTTQGL